MAFAERVRRARRRRCCEARFSAAALSRASSSAAARAFASALDAVPSEPVELVRTGTAPKLPAGSIVETKVGGHHGMLILALYELQEVVEDAAGEGSRGRFGKVIHFRPLKLALALGALGAAGVELSEDLRPGAHHGVALLAGVLAVKTCVSIWEAR